MEDHCLATIIHFLLLTSVYSMERRGRLTDRDLASVEDLLNQMENNSDMRNIEIPPPPHTNMRHRDRRILCVIGDKDYCPGEVLFRRECELLTNILREGVKIKQVE